MGQKLEVTFKGDKVIFLNPKTAKAEGFDYITRVEGKTAASQLRKEVDGRPNVTRAALSVLIEVYQQDRLAAYKGATALNKAIPKEFKQAMREAESAVIRPLFIAMLPKSMPDSEKAATADKYLSECWAGGVYAMVKAATVKYFCHIGKFPCVYNEDGTPDTDKLLGTDAINKLIQNAKEDLPKEDDVYKHKVVKAIMETAALWAADKSKDKPDANEVKVALAALNQMAEAFKALDTEYATMRTVAGSAAALTEQVLTNAAKGEVREETAAPATV